MSGKLTWTPSATGRFHCRIQISDGYHLLPWQCDLRVLPPPAKPSSPPLRLSPSSHPNPFSSAVTITFRPSTERPLPATVLIYGITGQLLRTLIATPLSSGQHTVRWDGTDRRGHPVAAGIYLYRVECGNQRTGGKLLFLP
ncbi:MAG: T9SS type A sorting domain-containing protein [Gemmatimonadetes bacterium]|nr:T9SS type A sorting domain-containing protein [Gemmatimonadota bacterium]